MTGERKAWWKLAFRLKKGFQETQDAFTSTEFVEACLLLEEEWTEPSKMEYFMAQIAYYLVLANAKDPEKIKFEDFLLKFTFDDPGKSKELTEDEKAKKLAASKAFWMGWVPAAKAAAKKKPGKPVPITRAGKRKGR